MQESNEPSYAQARTASTEQDIRKQNASKRMQARTRGAPPRTAQQWQRPRRSQLTCLNASKNRMQGSSGRETQFAAPAELHVVFNDQCTNEHEWQILDALTSCTCPSRMQRPTWPNAEAKGSIRCKRTWPLSLARPPLIDPLAKCATTLSPLQLLHSRSDKETRSGPPAPHANQTHGMAQLGDHS